jgi:uncharacterized membrane protein YhfC
MDLPFIVHLANGLMMIAIPAGLALYLDRRWKLGWRLWLIGGATFILSQIGHIPFLLAASSALQNTPLANLPPVGRLLFNAAFLGLSAGLFEEWFRYGMFRWWAKDARSWRRAVLTGAGHGGVEAIVLGILALYGFIQFAAIRNADLNTMFSGSDLVLARQQVAAYWSMDWYDSMLGALERFFTIPIQITLAVIVLQSFVRGQVFWVWLAVLYHAFVDAITVLAVQSLGIYWSEVIIGGFAVLSLVILFGLHRPEPEPVPGTAEALAPPIFKGRPLEESAEKLDDTRYL